MLGIFTLNLSLSFFRLRVRQLILYSHVQVVHAVGSILLLYLLQALVVVQGLQQELVRQERLCFLH